MTALTDVTARRSIELVGVDGDDTLWHCQRSFDEATERFAEIVRPWVEGDVDVALALDDAERRNLAVFGFGVKAFTLSMIEAATDVGGDRIPAAALMRLVELAKEMMLEPIELLPEVHAGLAALADDHRLALVTKGDLLHQRRKLADSGLEVYFDHVEVVPDKSPVIYADFLERRRIEPARFVMIGDSVRSDVLPVLAIGGRAVHVRPQHQWGHEHAHHDGSVPTVDTFGAVPEALERLVSP